MSFHPHGHSSYRTDVTRGSLKKRLGIADVVLLAPDVDFDIAAAHDAAWRLRNGVYSSYSPARICPEKSAAWSAARARALMCARRCSSSNGRLLSSLPISY